MPSFSSIFGTDVDPERRNTLLLLGGISLIVIFALGLVAYGYYNDRIAPSGESVLRVGDREFSFSYLERRVRSEQLLGAVNANNFTDSILRILGQMEREELIRIAARNQGISASDKQIAEQIKRDVGAPATMSRDDAAPLVRNELQERSLSYPDYREIMRSRVLENEMRAVLKDSVPSQAEQVNLYLIEAATQAQALRAKQRLDAGEDFGAVSADLSTGELALSEDGAAGWVPRGLLPQKLEDAAFATNGRSDIIETEDGFYILDVRGKETREIDENLRERVTQRRFEELLRETQAEAGTDPLLTTGQLQRLAQSLGVTGA
jgi:parvulin-like peptidyl-prolyl isomerase